MRKNIVIYSNCAGNVLKTMFLNHELTHDKFNIDHIVNYNNLDKENLSISHISLLKNCDIFIYQPMNNNYDFSQYNINYVKKNLKKECMIIRVNYYRFKGFWYECNYIPYHKYSGYSFHNIHGIYKEIKNLSNKTCKNSVVNFINNIQINENELNNFFDTELKKLKLLDDCSDVNMYDFFELNYKDKILFHDQFHPTNIFFYEIFRQLIEKICCYKLPKDDNEFLSKDVINNIEMTHWVTPILPIVRDILKLNYKDTIECFHLECHPKKIFMNIYDYYYIRLSPENFENYLKSVL